MQIDNLAKWIDELQASIENLKKKIDKAYKDTDGLPTFDINNPEDGQTLLYDGGDSSWKNYGVESGGVSFYDLIEEPITTTGGITVEDMTGADFLCFGIGVTASGIDQIFESYVGYDELKRSGAVHFVGGAFGNASGVFTAGAQVSVTDDTTINIAALTRTKWTENATIFYIRKVTIG